MVFSGDRFLLFPKIKNLIPQPLPHTHSFCNSLSVKRTSEVSAETARFREELLNGDTGTGNGKEVPCNARNDRELLFVSLLKMLSIDLKAPSQMTHLPPLKRLVGITLTTVAKLGISIKFPLLRDLFKLLIDVQLSKFCEERLLAAESGGRWDSHCRDRFLLILMINQLEDGLCSEVLVLPKLLEVGKAK
jgi:hypothetical protein